MRRRELANLADDDRTGQPMSTHSPFERAYRGVMRGLYEGSFVPGQRLIAPDLMQMFDVGRGTIREVLHRLASGGVVSMEVNRGARVRKLSRREVGEILDIVEVLLGLAARGAAKSIRAGSGGEELRQHYDNLRPQASIENLPHFLQAREEYYRCIVRLSGNEELQRLFPAAQVHIMRVQLRSFQLAADSVEIGDYAELNDAILSADPPKAEAAGRRHVEFTRERVAQLPDRAFATD